MTFEDVIRAAAPKRADGASFPMKAPFGWAHLSEAVTRIAAGPLTPRWSDMLEFYPQILTLMAGEGLSADEERFRYNLAEQFCKICFEGNLLTGFRRIGAGGPVEAIDPDWWEMEDPLLPFRTWGFDPDDPLNSSPANWIWIERKSLKEQQGIAAGHGETKTTWAEGEMIPVRQALDILEQFIEDRKGPPAPLDAPAGARELKALCETGKVGSVAGFMVRTIRADVRGLDGIDCASRNHWPIPLKVWGGIALSPIQDWSVGALVSKPPGRDGYRLTRVLVNRCDLLKHLHSIGRLWMAQWRIAGTEQIIAEGYVLPEVEPPQPDELPETGARFPSDDVAVANDEGSTGDPGRPELGTSLYLAEFQRRATEGLLNETLIGEARTLRDWFKTAYPLRQAPGEGTIKNRIRDLHREHRKSLTK